MTTIGRKEDMSPNGQFVLHRQIDGDYILTIYEDDGNGDIVSSASCEFTAPVIGGGASPETWKALGKLLEAMKRDHEDSFYAHRRGHLIE